MGSLNSSKNLTLPVSNFSKSEDNPQKASAMTRRGAYAALSYMACAVLLVMFNKAALSSYSFPCANVITLFQLLCSCLFLYILKRWGIISFTVSDQQSVTHGSTAFVPLKILIHTLPVAFSYLLYMLVSMESVRGINVPMYTTLRRTTVAFTMIVEYFLAGQTHSASVVSSVGIIILGAFIAGARDLSFDSYAYAVVFLSNICTAVYLAMISRIGKSSGLNSFGLMWCNGIICGPILLLWTFIRGDLDVMMKFPYLYYPGFQDLLTIGVGWLLFGGLPFDLLNVVGQCIGFLGACVYAYCKVKGK
ncbi:UDP-N-acetylglucosamine transporter UGNT1-like isoform X2 [Malania oleifera]|uniref:UDP-N-acetylglucosamine transporter UGNT1-like isoform X2 n=1 Tax=Malania oleifera TaxID=397392 RepID=UPI0025AE9E12|nr:UDP-N-acetylglucosamine transporter UGNT1-like isoform X2 [Malania oleifera]